VATTPSREYITLALVKGRNKRCRDDYIGHTLQGNILENQKEISIQQILEAEEGKNKPRLVLVEGAPGIGKSTLAWELCRNWEKFACMRQFSLVVLLRLREQDVHKITNTSQLFCSFECRDKDSLVKKVTKSQGRGILFILDGFDELPKQLQQRGFLLNLIKGKVLPQSTVLVTSRPLATGELFTTSRPQIHKHVEVLGFTQQSIDKYATSIFLSEPEKLQKFKAYISSSTNPTINSLMYVPLNAAIIVEIYRNSKSDSFLPHTLTELYTQLCLTILNRHLKIHHPSVIANKFEDLPSDLYQQFLHLSRVAFEAVESDKIILHSVSSGLVHFGFLDAVSALYGGCRVSYNFLHLTVQEFFAAYHISHLGSSGLQLFQQYGKVQRWNVVWRFVAGLTKFKAYQGHIDRSIFIQANDQLQFSLFLFQCLFEAQSVEHFSSAVVTSPTTAVVCAINPTSLDAYALGYCIANFPIGVSWDVRIYGVSHHSFTCSLNTNIPSVGVVEKLEVYNCPLDYADLQSNPLHATTLLRLQSCQLTNADMIHLSQLIPHLTCLKTLNINNNRVTDGQQDGLLKVLHQLYHSNVTALNIANTGLGELLTSPHDYSSAIKRLINPSSGTLEKMGVGHLGHFKDINDDELADLLSAPSSLKILSLYIDSLSPHALHLKNNTWLVTLQLACFDLSPQVPDLVDIRSQPQQDSEAFGPVPV